MISFRTLLSLLLVGMLAVGVGCTSDDDRPDPADAPRTIGPSTDGEGYPAIQQSALEEPFPAPSLTLETMDGDQITLDAVDGVAVVNFWATWCPPCRHEIPDLIDLQNEYGDKGLVVLGISRDNEGAEVVTPYAEDMEINYPLVVGQDDGLEEALGSIYALPTTLLISPDGMVTHRIMGLFDVDSLREQLDTWLDADAAVADRS